LSFYAPKFFIKSFLARWGGEEFVVIADHTNINQLIQLVEKIQNEIANISFNPVPKVTL